MNLEERILKVIKENIESDEEITKEQNLIEDLGLDSFGSIMLIDALEDEFDVNIEEEDFSDISTVQGIIDRIKEEAGKMV